jgi:hypothetical protein
MWRCVGPSGLVSFCDKSEVYLHSMLHPHHASGNLDGLDPEVGLSNEYIALHI